MVKSGVSKVHVERSMQILQECMIEEWDKLWVTPVFCADVDHPIISFFDCKPTDPEGLKKCTTDSTKEMQLYYETWSEVEDCWVISRFTPEVHPSFQIRLLRQLETYIQIAIDTAVEAEYYEEALLLTELKEQFIDL